MATTARRQDDPGARTPAKRTSDRGGGMMAAMRARRDLGDAVKALDGAILQTDANTGAASRVVLAAWLLRLSSRA